MKTYRLEAVEKYINQLVDYEIVEIPGTLLDTYIINHGFAVEVFEVKYLNSWSSTYIRHIYRKRIPQRLKKWIEQALTELAEDQGKDDFIDNAIACYEHARDIFESLGGK